jgi:hypothetical protein
MPMGRVINFPTNYLENSSADLVGQRVAAVDRVTQMHPDELAQAAQLVEDDVGVEWIDRFTEQGITHRIGATAFRRVRKGCRILAGDDVGVVSHGWLKAQHQALETLRKDWDGRITLVWNLVREEGHTSPEHVEPMWNDIVSGNSPLQRIIAVQHRTGAPVFRTGTASIDEPVILIGAEELNDYLDQVEREEAEPA